MDLWTSIKRNHLFFYSLHIEFFCFFVNITLK